MNARRLGNTLVAILAAGGCAVLAFVCLVGLFPATNADAVSTCAAMYGAPALAVFVGIFKALSGA